MKEPENPYSEPVESGKPEKKLDIVELLLYWLFAVPMALFGLFLIIMFCFVLWYISRH